MLCEDYGLREECVTLFDETLMDYMGKDASLNESGPNNLTAKIEPCTFFSQSKSFNVFYPK